MLPQKLLNPREIGNRFETMLKLAEAMGGNYWFDTLAATSASLLENMPDQRRLITMIQVETIQEKGLESRFVAEASTRLQNKTPDLIQPYIVLGFKIVADNLDNPHFSLKGLEQRLEQLIEHAQKILPPTEVEKLKINFDALKKSCAEYLVKTPSATHKEMLQNRAGTGDVSPPRK